ncbi:uncharacterized protein RHO17_010583 isoform 1-T2 [Thomomys bottae]
MLESKIPHSVHTACRETASATSCTNTLEKRIWNVCNQTIRSQNANMRHSWSVAFQQGQYVNCQVLLTLEGICGPLLKNINMIKGYLKKENHPLPGNWPLKRLSD